MRKRIALGLRTPDLLEHPDFAKWTYDRTGGSFPVWESHCQKRVTLTVAGLRQDSAIDLIERHACPSCGWVLTMRVGRIQGAHPGHFAGLIAEYNDWQSWLVHVETRKRTGQLSRQDRLHKPVSRWPRRNSKFDQTGPEILKTGHPKEAPLAQRPQVDDWRTTSSDRKIRR